MKDKKYFFANWKMYLNYQESVDLAKELVKEKFAESVSVAVFPSALAAEAVGEILRESDIAVGAQNVFWLEKGGYTGEVSADMFKEVGCKYALVGHSERRHVFHETNHEVRQKMERIIAAGLTPVLCVGETLEEKKEGQTQEVIEAQLRAALTDLSLENSIIIAYEPVWAIGTGEACDPGEAEKMSENIKKLASALLNKADLIILYGGSVRPENVGQYISSEHIDGVLVGGASAKLSSWEQIVNNS